MGKQPKPQRWWGVTYVNRQTEVMPDTIRRTRRDAQKACCEGRYPYNAKGQWQAEWKEWHRRGCRAVRVIVTVEAAA